MKRHLYNDDHEAFRGVVREFVRREVVDNIQRWEDQGRVDRDVWTAAAKQGIIGLFAPVEYGGAGQGRDFRFRNVVIEELTRVHASSLQSNLSLQDDLAIPYVMELGTDEQKKRWLPGLASGELLAAIAMTEPGTGSDLRGIATKGTKVDGGWIVNGSKTFITNGIQSDLVIAVVRTDPEGGSRAFSLLVVERDMPGFSRGRKLAKLGLHGQDTAELSFDDVFVPDENVLGGVGDGFGRLIHYLPLERLSIAAAAVGAATAIFSDTLAYANAREIFGKPIADFQNSRFVLADIAIELDVARAFLDQSIRAYNDGDLSVVDAAKLKVAASEMSNRVVDRCLQMHGGYGYMMEYPVARAYADLRIQRIYGGASEVLRDLIGRDLVGRR